MQVRTLVVPVLAVMTALGAVAAQAQDSVTDAAGTTRYSATSVRSREAVVAELHNVQAAGDLRTVGELNGAAPVALVPAAPRTVTRAEVRAELAQARAQHQLRFGELM